MKRAILAGLLSVCAISANAATINYDRKVDGVSFVNISGQIVNGDSDKFNRVIGSITGPIVVVLRSPGGLLVEGLDIGSTIHNKRYGAAVPADAECASVCGLIWLAGDPRLLSESSKIGFHAAFNRESGQESGSANAIVGAYLNQLGLSYKAIVYLTHAPPDSIQWLDPSDAAEVGITYSLVPLREPARPFIAPQVPAQADQTTPAYLQGRQARIEYEQWFANLPQGNFREGASFWASHRSEKPVVSCLGGMPDWIAGCTTARARLTPSDIRRNSDKNFWSGWNSV